MPTNTRPPEKRRVDTAIRRLYRAVDRTIRAADEARKARDEIIRLSVQTGSTKGSGDER